MKPSNLARAILLALAALFAALPALAQAVPDRAPTVAVDVKPLPAVAMPVHFNAEKATAAYLARVSGAARARSDAYFEGGYVLQLVDALYAIAVAALLLWTRLSAWMRNNAARVTRFRFLQAAIYVVQYVVLTTVLTLPLTIYEEFLREHAYGLSNQTFLQWSGDFGTGFVVILVEMTILISVVYAVIRATPRYWWAWSAIVVVAFLFIEVVIQPVLISPLFNTYTPLPDGKVKQEILSLARANGIPADNVYEFDASRQSNRISANVSGFLGTTRISMTDNLMKTCTPAEIKAVLGHEMGHYVLDHQAFLLTNIGLIVLLGFIVVNWGFGRLAGRFGARWDVHGIDDPAGLPALIAIGTVFALLMTPVLNTIVRTAEHEADMYGLNASREPDGFATVTLKLANYRKLDPSPLEEFIFYDHPSGHTRIYDAMRWKAEHLNDPDIMAGPVSPE